jgi:hypothetical protein
MNWVMSPFVTWSFCNLTLLEIQLKVFATSIIWRMTQVRCKSRVHLMSWMTILHPPFVAIQNWWEKRLHKLKVNMINKLIQLFLYMGKPLLKVWPLLKGESLWEHVQCVRGCNLEPCGNIVETIVGSQNLQK